MSQGLTRDLTPKHIVLFLKVHTFIMFDPVGVRVVVEGQETGVQTQARWLECIGSLADQASCLHLNTQQSCGRYVCSHFPPHLTLFIKAS